MKITDIRVLVRVRAMDGTHRNPRFVWRAKQTLLVFVFTDDGRIGTGEAWSDGGGAGSIAAFIAEDLKPRLLGRDPHLVEGFWREALDTAIVSTRRSQTAAAMSAVDIALWDLKGQAAGLPLWRLLGGDGRGALAYASGGLYREGQSAAEFGAEYAAFASQGFRAVKIKVGGAPVATDIARIAALRQGLGEGPLLMIDAVSNCDVPHALRLARAAAPHDITWFEQPVPIDDLEGQARIAAASPIPLCGNENEYGIERFRRLMETGAIHYVQFDPVISGGITMGRKIAALAESRHLPVTLHHSNSIVSMAANLHLAWALPNAHSVEYHVIHQPLFERAPAGFLALGDGRIAPDERPGLGLDLRDLAAEAQ